MNTHLLLALPLFLFACGGTAPVAASPGDPAKAPAQADLIVGGTLSIPEGTTPVGEVFVSVKAVGRPGPPLAAKKLPLGPFPLAFTLTTADRPMANGPIPDTFEVKVTIDSDGNPMSRNPADPTATVEGRRGQTDLAVTLVPSLPAVPVH